MDTHLPSDLADLERRLAGRSTPAEPAGLRGRVLRAVADELRARRASRWWVFAGQAAAVVLLGINLAFSAAQVTIIRPARAAGGESIELAAGRIREALPELSAREARRQALLLRAAGEAAWGYHVDLPPAGQLARSRRDARRH